MAYLRLLVMLEALSARIERVGLHLLVSSARVMAANSALLIVCRSGCDLFSLCVIVYTAGFRIDAPCIGLPVT